jgi:SAM-dependent methyltransferase
MNKIPNKILKDRWDRRARENPMYYIAAERSDWTESEFLASGEQVIAEYVDPIMPLLSKLPIDCSVLEIGCGLGRLARPLAKRFKLVEAIDISPLMIHQAKEFVPPVPQNIVYQVCDGSGLIPLSAESVDFVFSFIVFQHIPHIDIIETYFSEANRVLVSGGIVLVQLNTHLRTFKERLRFGIVASDRVPIVKKKIKLKLDPHNTMGAVLKPSYCERLARKNDFQILKMSGRGTQYTWITMQKML